MAKKRLDRKRDKSSGQRIAQFGKAALTVGVGVALLGRTRLDKRLLNELVPTVRKTKDVFRKELLNKKITASNLEDAYKKAIGKKGSVFKETLEAQKKKKYKLRTDRTSNIAGRYRAIDNTTMGTIYDDMDVELVKQIKKKNAEQLKTQY